MRPYGERTGKVTYPMRRTRSRTNTMNIQHDATRSERMRIHRQPRKAERQLAKRELRQL